MENKPLQIDELTDEVCRKYNAVLWGAFWKLTTRLDELNRGEESGRHRKFVADEGLDPYLPEWVVAKIKQACRRVV